MKNLDLRVFEFSDLGILQKSAMYFVAWLGEELLDDELFRLEKFFLGVFFVPWLITIQSLVGKTFVALVEFFKGGRGVLVGWMV